MNRRRIASARVDGHGLYVELSDGSRGWFPLGFAPRLDLARQGQLVNLELREEGEFVYWPDLDDGLELREIERWIFPIPEDVNPPHGCERMLAASSVSRWWVRARST
jgi:hypothetical protein